MGRARRRRNRDDARRQVSRAICSPRSPSPSGWAARCRGPTTTPGRMIEPQLVEPAREAPVAATPMLVRLLETQARAHIGRRLLHQQPDGELTEDPVWHWSSAPDRYLDTALRLELAASPNVRLVDVASAPVMVATLLEWQVESGSETQAGWGRRGAVHGNRSRRPHAGGPGSRARLRRAARHAGGRRGPPAASPCFRRPGERGSESLMGRTAALLP